MAEEKGLVNENSDAVVRIRLRNGNSLECVIDTGFNGELMLPREFVEENSMELLGREPVVTVEQNSIEVDIAVAETDWLDEKLSVQVLVSEKNEALMGVEMFADALLEIDYRNKSVKITK